MTAGPFDVVVAGAGNAALCAAVGATLSGARVLVLEKAPRESRSGNSIYAGGAARYAYGDWENLRRMFPGVVSDELAATVEVDPYTVDEFYTDLMNASDGKADPEIIRTLAEQSPQAVRWLMSIGIPYHWEADSDAFMQRNGRTYFNSGVKGAPIGPIGKMRGVIATLFDIIESKSGNEVRYEHTVVGLVKAAGGGVEGVRAQTPHGPAELRAGAVVLGCGGFEASPELRKKYLGPQWEQIKVRGTRHNTADWLDGALEAGAVLAGDIHNCHAKGVFLSAPDFDSGHEGAADYERAGLMVNVEGERFLDEGWDIQEITNSRHGRLILQQTGKKAYQVFDSVGRGSLSRYYNQGAHVVADTIEGLPDALRKDGHPIDGSAMVETIRVFNAAAPEGVADFTRKDGRRTQGLNPDKTNWAQRIEKPPFLCYPVTAGITFTFGGLRVDPQTHVLDKDGNVIRGLYAVGEAAGTYFGYHGGSGIMKGFVFGRIAGETAAAELDARRVTA